MHLYSAIPDPVTILHYHVCVLRASDRATEAASVLIVEPSPHTSKMMPLSSEKS